nr:MAG TPA: hypothetical protein [Caudoviricetes sp.]
MRNKHRLSARKSDALNHRGQSPRYFIRFIQGLSKQSKCSVNRILGFRRSFQKATILTLVEQKSRGRAAE